MDEKKQIEKAGCYVCGSELIYSTKNEIHTCGVCGKDFSSNMVCPNAHFICNECHIKFSLGAIEFICRTTKSTDPLEIAIQIMSDDSVPMHGPEHHIIVGSALLAAYANAGGVVDLDEGLQTIKIRAKSVPGGICGSWGSCGAAISAGIFFSTVTQTTSLSKESWGLSNQMTSECLAAIGAQNGPRCCKRDSYLAIKTAVGFVKEHLDVSMTLSDITCQFYSKNKQCKSVGCPFFPK